MNWKTVLIYLSTSCTLLWGKDPPPQYIIVTEVHEGYLLYYQYDAKGPNRVNLSDLNISERVIGDRDPFGEQYRTIPDFKLLLLQKGWASLKDPAAAPPLYRAAQQEFERQMAEALQQKREMEENERKEREKAEAERIAQEALDKQRQAEERDRGPSLFKRFWQSSCVLVSLCLSYVWNAIIAVLKWLRSMWLWILSIGIMSFLLKLMWQGIVHLYKRIAIQRRVRLLIIGFSGAGKTAICLRILDPDVAKEAIQNVSPSVRTEKLEKNECIREGRYEIYPILKDVRGPEFETIWDELASRTFLHYHTAMLLSLAPTNRLTSPDSPALQADDEKFLDRQFVFCQFIAGFLNSKLGPKPRIVIIFLGKFDLLAKHGPADTSSQNSRKAIEGLFANHVDIMKAAGRKAKIPVEVIVGSALNNWNVEWIIKTIGKELYSGIRRLHSQ